MGKNAPPLLKKRDSCFQHLRQPLLLIVRGNDDGETNRGRCVERREHCRLFRLQNERRNEK